MMGRGSKWQDHEFEKIIARLSGLKTPDDEARVKAVEPKLLYGTPRIAEYFGVHKQTLFRWEREYGFPLRRLNGYCFVVIADLEQWGRSARRLKKRGIRGVAPSQKTTRLVGVTKETVRAYAEARGNKCDICESEFATSHISPHLDHDHRTNVPRGILCRACNHGIGNFKDNPELLKKAIAYLERPPWNHETNSTEEVHTNADPGALSAQGVEANFNVPKSFRKNGPEMGERIRLAGAEKPASYRSSH